MKRGFFAAVVVLTLAVLGAIPVLAATQSTPFQATRLDSPEGQPLGRWGERLAAAGDVNNDGIPDFFVAAPRHDVGPDTTGVGENAGRVYMVSGRDGSVLRKFDSPEVQKNAQFGFFISVVDDVDRRGEYDIAIGTDAQDVGTNTDQGKAWMFSSETGSKLYDMDNPAPQGSARFGSRIGRAGDVTGDRIADVIVGASNNDLPAGCGTAGAGCRRDAGQAFIFNGTTGARVRTLDLPAGDVSTATCAITGSGGQLGIAVQGPGDVDRDGVEDQLVDAGSYGCQGRMYVFSGRDGSVLHRIDNPQPEVPGPFGSEYFGFQDATPLAPGDVNGDGHPDLYGHGFLTDGPAGEGQGRAWVFSGRDGTPLYRLDDPTPSAGGQFGWSLARTEYNHDGRPDLYVGQAPHHVAGGDQNGGTYVMDGRDGSELKRLEMPESDRQSDPTGVNAGPRLGWGLAAPGDLNRDGEPDYLGGAPFADVGANQDQGVVYAFVSRACPRGTSEGVRCTALPGGRTYITGTSGSDTIIGTNGNDVINAGAGDDVVYAGAGNDRIYGKTGNDRVSGGDGNDRISGGRGDDNLSGRDGDDYITGESGNDRISGGTGNDLLLGNEGDDYITGDAGRDRIDGGPGRDREIQ